MSRRLDCAIVRDKLPLYALDDLDGDARRVVRDHVARCAACARECRDFDRTLGWLDELDGPAPVRLPLRPRRRRWLGAALVAAAVVLIAIVASRATSSSASRLAMAGDGEAIVSARSEVALEGVDRLRLLRGEILLRAGRTSLFAHVGDEAFEVGRGGAVRLTWREAAGPVAIAAMAGLVFVVSPGGAREAVRPGSTVERDAKRRQAPRTTANAASDTP